MASDLSKIENTLLEKLRTHINHTANGRIIADLYQTRLGDYKILINMEDPDGVQVCHIELIDNDLMLWADITS